MRMIEPARNLRETRLAKLPRGTTPAVEVLEPGDSVDMLFSPTGETRVYRASGGPHLNLDKATPILQGYP